MIEVEVRGGLGDCFITLHETRAADELEQLDSNDRCRVTIISHNPFVDELWRWHPKSSQIDILKSRHFFMPPYNDPRIRREAGVPETPPEPRPPRERAPIRFYPSPEDLRILAADIPTEPFLAIAPTSSGMEIENRNIPLHIIVQICALARVRRIPVVFLGRTYQGPHAHKATQLRPAGGNIVDMTDRLSVPGTVEVVKRCGAVVSAHSALLLLSWYEHKPNFLLYPPKYKWHDFDNKSPFGFGKDYPETTRMLFSEFAPLKFGSFLSVSFLRRVSS